MLRVTDTFNRNVPMRHYKSLLSQNRENYVFIVFCRNLVFMFRAIISRNFMRLAQLETPKVQIEMWRGLRTTNLELFTHADKKASIAIKFSSLIA